MYMKKLQQLSPYNSEQMIYSKWRKVVTPPYLILKGKLTDHFYVESLAD